MPTTTPTISSILTTAAESQTPLVTNSTNTGNSEAIAASPAHQVTNAIKCHVLAPQNHIN